MNFREFDNQVAIVTGGGQGIGFEICRQLAVSGASVVINDIEESLCRDAVIKISSQSGKCLPVTGDASSEAGITTLIDQTVSHFGRLDLLVANAGITLFGDFLNYSREDFEKVIQTNQAGSYFLAQAAARQMIAQESGGSILFMSSVVGHQSYRDLSAYAMTKASLEMLAKNLVVELAPHSISTNAIAPGATLTERTSTDPEYENKWSGVIPSGRPATPTDIANAALFLLSPASRYITGQTLVVDGGWTSVSHSPY